MSARTAREAVRDAYLAAGLPAHVHAQPPSAITPPAVIVVPGDPYYDPTSIGDAVLVELTLRITIFASRGDTTFELDELEQLAARAMAALPNGHTVGPLSRPSRVQLDDSGELFALSASFDTTTRIDALEASP